jgi:hypothetical protein
MAFKTASGWFSIFYQLVDKSRLQVNCGAMKGGPATGHEIFRLQTSKAAWKEMLKNISIPRQRMMQKLNPTAHTLS